MFHVMLCSSLRLRNHGNPMRQEYVPSSCYVMFTFTLCSKFTFMLCHAQVHVMFQVHVQIIHVHVHVMFQVHVQIMHVHVHVMFQIYVIFQVHVHAMFRVTFMLSFSFSLSYASYVMLYVKLCYDYL